MNISVPLVLLFYDFMIEFWMADGLLDLTATEDPNLNLNL